MSGRSDQVSAKDKHPRLMARLACPALAAFVLLTLAIVLIQVGAFGKLSVGDMLSVVLASATVAYAFITWKTLKSMEIVRVESFRPVVAIRYHDRDADERGLRHRQEGSVGLAMLHQIESAPTRYGLWLENVGKGPALNVSVWINLRRDAKGNLVLDFDEKFLELYPDQSRFAFPLAADCSNLDVQINFANAPVPVLTDQRAKLLVQYADVFGNYYATLHMLGSQRVAPLPKALPMKAIPASTLQPLFS